MSIISDYNDHVQQYVSMGLTEDEAKYYASIQLSRNKSIDAAKNMVHNHEQRVLSTNTILLDSKEIIDRPDKIIIPNIVITTEGVMNRGYKPMEELAKSWWTFKTHCAVTDRHPDIQANEIGLIKGHLEDVKFDTTTGDVSADAHIYKLPDTQQMIDDILSGGRKEVSIGFWCDEDRQSGTFQNKRLGINQDYDYIERNMVADHLAILAIGEKGACSPEMGCGIMGCNSGIGDPMTDEEIESTETVEENTSEPQEAVEEVIETPTTPPVADTESALNADAEELRLLRDELDALKRQPLIDELVELTGWKPERFASCNMAALVRQIEVHNNAIATRKNEGMEHTPVEYAMAYDKQNQEWVKISPGESR